ncbi:MAG: LuxR C-terminal-related transcriptional regulator [Rhizomicrobium sp.]
MRSAYGLPPIGGDFGSAADISEAKSRINALTPRGRDVLNGIVDGCSNKAIAHKLGISPRTVEIHRARMMRDLGARHVADAIRMAFEGAPTGRSQQDDGPLHVHKAAPVDHVFAAGGVQRNCWQRRADRRIAVRQS